MKLTLLFTSILLFGFYSLPESPNDFDYKLSDIVRNFKSDIMDKDECENQKRAAGDLADDIEDAIKNVDEYNSDEIIELKQLEKEGRFDTTDRFSVYGIFGRIISVIISISAGLTGGLVIPALTIGCGIGSWLSKYTNIDQHKLMFLGMVALVSSFLNAPFTSAVLINKICNQPYDSIPLSLGVSFISYFTYRFLQSKF